MWRAYRPKTPERAANSFFVHFLFSLIFKYDAPPEQEHRSQDRNDMALGWLPLTDVDRSYSRNDFA
jgi:hypothetical protein